MIKNQYETIFILTPVLSNEDVQRRISKYTTFLKDNGSEIVAEEHWGLKQLAYQIGNVTTGIYHIVYHNTDTQVIEKLNTEFKRDEYVIRELTVRLDKYGEDYNNRRRKGEVGPNRKKKAAETTTNEEA